MGDVTRLCESVSCRSVFVARAPNHKYCSKRCKEKSNLAQQRERGPVRNPLRVPVECVECGETFLRKSADHKFCSGTCKRRAKARRRRKVHSSRPCRIAGCENAGIRSSQLCEMHYARRQKGIPMDVPKQEVHGRRQSETCTVEGCDRETYWLERCKRHWLEHHARLGKTWAVVLYAPGGYRPKAEAYGGAYEVVDRFEVFERDGWVCQLCGEPVDPELKWPDVMSPSLDHIVPFVHGGDHSYENVQLAHLSCNSRKSDRMGV